MNEFRLGFRISLKFVPMVRINNIPALVHIMAWRRPGDKPSSEPMVVSLTTHVCVTRPQWVNVDVIKYDWHLTGLSSLSLLVKEDCNETIVIVAHKTQSFHFLSLVNALWNILASIWPLDYSRPIAMRIHAVHCAGLVTRTIDAAAYRYNNSWKIHYEV